MLYQSILVKYLYIRIYIKESGETARIEGKKINIINRKSHWMENLVKIIAL